LTKGQQAGADEVTQLLQRAVTPQRMPGLQKLKCNHEWIPKAAEQDALAALVSSAWLSVLPRLSTLTSLSLR